MMSDTGSSLGPANESSAAMARDRSVVAMLRQLWLGLSTYRLYPENPERPGFHAAAERIRAAAEDALRGGPVDLEIRGERFVLGGEPLANETNVERLALACFERRVERLIVLATPSAAELERLFAALSQTARSLEEAGGIEDVLARGGVTSLSLSPIGPGAVEESDHVMADAPAPASRPVDVELLASQLMLEDLHGTPGDQAETLLARLRTLIAEGSLGDGPPIDVHSAVHDLVTDLPDDVRRSLVEILVDRVREDPLAGRLIGTMSSSQLTRALVDVGRAGERNPVELARDLAAAGVREVDIVDLTRALEAGHEDVGTIIAGLEQVGIDLGDERDLSAGGSVLEVLSEYLTATERDDVRSIQEAVASAPTMRAAQISAVADYLTLETDLERTGEAVDIWAEQLRRALRERDQREVTSLLQPLRDVLLGAGEERAALYAACVRRALAPDVVMGAVTDESADERSNLAGLLAPFGDDGVDALLDLLADEQDRGRRVLLFGALRRIAPDHPKPVLARLSDSRWFVVRNAVMLLGSGLNPAVLPRLEEAARHGAEEVRREVPDAIAAAGGAAGVPFLVRMALDAEHELALASVTSLGTLVGEDAAAGLAEVVRDASDHAIRLRALEELAELPQGRSLLEQLSSRGAGARLPWRLRRHARRALARSRGTR